MNLDHNQTGVMIALIPMVSNWTDVERPHMTLVYAGSTAVLHPTTFNELGKDALSLSLSFSPLTLDVLGIETFGKDEEKVDVLRLKPSKALLAMRSAVEVWNASEFPYNPHVTIGPVGTVPRVMPSKITFDQIYFGWGLTGSTYRLRP